MKSYKGEEERIEPPEEGWAILMFSDGRKAELAKAVIRKNAGGEEMINMYVRPYPETKRAFKIDNSELDRFGFVWKNYPIDYVILLNRFDPTRKVFFCICGWNGEKTETTDWFLGHSQVDEIKKLKEENIKLKSQLAVVKEENIMLKEDIDSYITKNIDRLITPLMPIVRGIIVSESQKDGR